MRKALETDRLLVIDILVKSFENNKSVNHIVKQDRLRSKRIRALMDYSFSVCLLAGEIWISDDNAGCALVLYPHRKKTRVWSIFLDIKLAFSAIGVFRVSSILRREKQIKRHHPDREFLYLWFIGVDPVRQKQGIGSRLLAHVVDISAPLRLPVLLETSALRNVTWYKKHGFEVYKTLEFSYKLFLLRKVT